MDPAVLESLKRKYRKQLLNIILNDAKDHVHKLKKMDVIDVIRWIAKEWKHVQQKTIVKVVEKIIETLD